MPKMLMGRTFFRLSRSMPGTLVNSSRHVFVELPVKYMIKLLTFKNIDQLLLSAVHL